MKSLNASAMVFGLAGAGLVLSVVDILSPFIFLANVFTVWRFSAGPFQFPLEFVGDGAMVEVQLTPTCRINGGLGKIVMPVHVDVCTSQVISIHIQLLQERQFFIFLFFICMTFNMNKGDVFGQVTFMNCVPDFCNDIPVGFHGGVRIGCLVL